MTRDPWFWIVVVAIVLALGGGAFWRARKRVSRAKIESDLHRVRR